MGFDYTCNITVRNCDKNVERYIVARTCDGEMWFWGSFNDHDMALRVAQAIDGVVVERQG